MITWSYRVASKPPIYTNTGTSCYPLETPVQMPWCPLAIFRMTSRFMREANYCCLFMGFGAFQIHLWFWSAAPQHATLFHKRVVVAHVGRASLESNVTVHRKSLKMAETLWSCDSPTGISHKERTTGAVTDVCTGILITSLFLCRQKCWNPLNSQQYGKFNEYIIMQPLKIMTENIQDIL